MPGFIIRNINATEDELLRFLSSFVDIEFLVGRHVEIRSFFRHVIRCSLGLCTGSLRISVVFPFPNVQTNQTRRISVTLFHKVSNICDKRVFSGIFTSALDNVRNRRTAVPILNLCPILSSLRPVVYRGVAFVTTISRPRGAIKRATTGRHEL